MSYDLYPAVDENYEFPPQVRAALAASADLRNQAIPMTQTERNNLSGPELWDGRLVANTTSDHIDRYDAGTSTWMPLSNYADLDALSSAVASDVASIEGRLDDAESDLLSLDAPNVYTRARILSTSAGLQQNVNGRWLLDTGFPAPRTLPPIFSFSRLVSGTNEMEDWKATAYEAGNGVVYLTGAGVSLGLAIRVTRID